MIKIMVDVKVQYHYEPDRGGWHPVGPGGPANPLTTACLYGHVDVVQLLLANGANINPEGYTALFAACKKSHIEVIELLLNNGADDSVLEKVDRSLGFYPYRRLHNFFPIALQTLQSVQENILQREQTKRTSQLTRDAEKLPVLTGFGKSVSENVLDIDVCYKHATKVRHTRRGVIDLLTNCCAVLMELQSAKPAERSAEHFTEAEAILVKFHQLQQQIRTSEDVNEDAIRERNRVRSQAIDLISIALLHRSENPVARIQDRAVEALDTLRTCAPSQDEDSTGALGFEDMRQMCMDACSVSEQFTTALGHMSDIRAECDTSIQHLREQLPFSFCASMSMRTQNSS
ncbi:hypothetical protein SARC_01876 [Sphaeroforma arctica JP610]|uniref:Peptidase A2 domain-containing protein n=1 Tax=Sphaeroforma arctica JP610 TaxID=667725 RepID=A0A0L0GAB2_9EUKA|nr:hypothetical protein SARC_01876 [Sphaeroforma arctica JP610]KNC85972.1 hypothetical protein SARC_01876 [Sphaeroforma arctica JP610]|eukprot:XP_014159874.1 hypothetical protein SARC_01876 [Sphaeroforma arctica JP610]